MKTRSEKTLKNIFVEKIFIAGSGGQGVLFLGKALYLTAIAKNLFSTYFPSYGAEVRGGTAKCMVTVSSRPIGNPIFRFPLTSLVLNAASFDKYGSMHRKSKRIILCLRDQESPRPFYPEQKIFSFVTSERFENIRCAALYARAHPWFSENDFTETLRVMLRSKESSLFEKNRDVFLGSFQAFGDTL